MQHPKMNRHHNHKAPLVPHKQARQQRRLFHQIHPQLMMLLLGLLVWECPDMSVLSIKPNMTGKNYTKPPKNNFENSSRTKMITDLSFAHLDDCQPSSHVSSNVSFCSSTTVSSTNKNFYLFLIFIFNLNYNEKLAFFECFVSVMIERLEVIRLSLLGRFWTTSLFSHDNLVNPQNCVGCVCCKSYSPKLCKIRVQNVVGSSVFCAWRWGLVIKPDCSLRLSVCSIKQCNNILRFYACILSQGMRDTFESFRKRINSILVQTRLGGSILCQSVSKFNFSGASPRKKARITSDLFVNINTIVNSTFYIIHNVCCGTPNNNSGYFRFIPSLSK
eukprot:m.44648 g.44648  ORF g.44648 m.44648 type:complete len:331 (+) comp10133_c0_seq1:3522-4514(+)